MSADLKHIQIFILCRDRPDYFKQVIKSALKQKITEYTYEIIVSDNSSTNSIYYIYKSLFSKFSNIKYIRRIPNLSALKHFEVVFSEANADYVTFFHDDDVLFPKYASIMADFLTLHGDISATACNAIEVDGDLTNIRRVSFSFLRKKFFNNKESILNQYLPGNGGLAPFSGYMFRLSSLSSNIFSNPDAGKHSDATILANLTNTGKIMWVPNILMCYRYHNNSDSSVEVVRDRRLLLQFMYKSGIDKANFPVIFFRIMYITNFLNQRLGIFKKNKFINYRKSFILRSLFSYYFWLALFFRQFTRSRAYFIKFFNTNIYHQLKEISKY